MKTSAPKPRTENRREALIQRARANPHEFFTFEECGLILGFSTRAMGRLNAAGAPVAFRRMNPALVCAWIAQNQAILAQIGNDEDTP